MTKSFGKKLNSYDIVVPIVDWSRNTLIDNLDKRYHWWLEVDIISWKILKKNYVDMNACAINCEEVWIH